MSTRYDVSRVPLQGGYVAKQCPVRAQNDALQPGEPLPPSPFRERLFRGGNDFEAEIVAQLTALHPAAEVIGGHAEEAEAATLAAMARGVALILGGRLPPDHVGRRVGRPDLLVASPGGGYRAVDVKWHASLEASRGSASEFPGRCSTLGAPALEAAAVDATYAARKREDDLLQLAHYQRMLEASGMAAAGGRWGAIVGTERRVVWYDLDTPWRRTPSATQTTKLRSTMERYDFEFAFRLDIIAVALQHELDPATELLVVPVKCAECDTCPWWDHCRPQLTAGAGDVSLLPRVGWSEWKVHRALGVDDRADLAALDVRTAEVVAAGVDVHGLMVSASGLPVAAPVAGLADGRQLDALVAAGVTTAGDVAALDAPTAAYSGTGMTSLPAQIDLARAALGPAPAYRRRGLAQLAVPRADVEVDVDMENVEAGCYLWGALVADRSGLGLERDGYRAFATWEALTPEVEAANSLEFWRWLMEVRAAAHGRGLSFRAYCWSAGAENTYLRRLGVFNEIADEVEAFIGSDEWVDMLDVWNRQVITGASSGLKVVAPLVGFSWRVDDAGGAESMLRYDIAVGGDGDMARGARRWLLIYNEGDVQATAAIRRWMESTDIPGIEAVAPSVGDARRS